MADEAILYLETAPPINFSCANATGIAKGAILKMTDPMTAIINSGANDMIAGVAAEEKIALDGKTRIAVYREGIFIMTAKAAFTAGDAVGISATANQVQAATVATVSSKTLGLALETSGGAGETVLVDLRPGCNNAAYS